MERIRAILGLLSRPAVFLGIIALVVAGGVYVAVPTLRYTVQYLLTIGLVFLLIFVLGAYNEIRQTLLGRKGKYGANTIVMVLIFVGIAILVNVLSNANHRRFDLTESKQYSLSPQTIKILKDLKSPITVTGFFETGDPYRDVANNLLTEYMYHTDKIKVEYVDPVTKPNVARQYQIKSAETLVFESGDHRQQEQSFTEQKFTSDILKVTGEQQKKIYFLTGHG